MQKNEIKSRLALLEKSQCDLQWELRLRGYDISIKSISAYNTGRRYNETIVNQILQILKQWENEKIQKS